MAKFLVRVHWGRFVLATFTQREKKITQQQQDLETLLAPEKARRELKIYFVSFIFVNTSSPDDYPNVCILLSLECT